MSSRENVDIGNGSDVHLEEIQERKQNHLKSLVSSQGSKQNKISVVESNPELLTRKILQQRSPIPDIGTMGDGDEVRLNQLVRFLNNDKNENKDLDPNAKYGDQGNKKIGSENLRATPQTEEVTKGKGEYFVSNQLSDQYQQNSSFENLTQQSKEGDCDFEDLVFDWKEKSLLYTTNSQESAGENEADISNTCENSVKSLQYRVNEHGENRIDEKNKKLNALQSEVGKDKCTDYENEMSEARDEIESLKTRLSETRKQAEINTAALELKLKEKETELSTTRINYEILFKSVKDKHIETCEQFQRKLQEAEEKIKALQKELDEYETKHLHDVEILVTNFENQITTNKQQYFEDYENAQADLSQAMQQIEVLNSQLNQAKEEGTQTLAVLNEQVQMQQAGIYSAYQTGMFNSQQQSEFQQHKEYLQQEFTNAQQMVMSLQSQLTHAQQHREKLQAELNNSQQHSVILQVELSKAQSKISDTNQKIVNLDSEISNANKERISLQKEYNECKKQLESLHLDLSQSQQENQRQKLHLENQIQKLEETCSEYELKLSNAQKQVELFKSDYSDIKTRMDRVYSHLKKNSIEFNKEVENQIEHTINLARTSAVHELIATENDGLKSKLNDMEVTLEEYKQKLDRQNFIDYKQHETKSTAEHVNSITCTQKSAFKAKEGNLKHKSSDVRKVHFAQNDVKSDEAFKEICSGLESDLKRAKEEIKSLCNELEQVKMRRKEDFIYVKRSYQRRLAAQHHKIKNRCIILEDELGTAKQEIQALQCELKEIKSKRRGDLGSLKDKCTELGDELDSSRHQMDSLKTELQQTKATRQDEIEKVKRTYQELIVKLEEKHAGEIEKLTQRNQKQLNGSNDVEIQTFPTSPNIVEKVNSPNKEVYDTLIDVEDKSDAEIQTCENEYQYEFEWFVSELKLSKDQLAEMNSELILREQEIIELKTELAERNTTAEKILLNAKGDWFRNSRKVYRDAFKHAALRFPRRKHSLISRLYESVSIYVQKELQCLIDGTATHSVNHHGEGATNTNINRWIKLRNFFRALKKENRVKDSQTSERS